MVVLDVDGLLAIVRGDVALPAAADGRPDADQMRDLFAQEAEVRLAQLGQLLLNSTLGDDTDTVDAIFREVHTLKGRRPWSASTR